MDTNQLHDFWSQRYIDKRTGWDIGAPSTPLKAYIDQLKDKTINILIPGAGNAYEAEYLWNYGFKNVHVLDISVHPLVDLKKRVPGFPNKQLIQENFFEHSGQYDLIIEQTFFCSFKSTLENRTNYASKMLQLLSPGGKLVGVWFNHTLDHNGKRPFGGSKEEYLSYFTPLFSVRTFEDCYNSIQSRAEKELFGILIKS